MKSVKTLLTLLAFSFVFTSCSKDDDDGAATGNGSLTAKVDGVNFNSTLAVQATLSSGVLAFGGTGSDGQITIAIPNYTAPGTFNLGAGNMSTATYNITTAPYTGYVASMVSGSGSIVVTELSGGYVKGTFSFTGMATGGATKAITEGKFNIRLQ